MSIGLFLGAGASYELGMPLVWELTIELKRYLTPEKLRALNAGWHAQGRGHSNEVIDDFARALSDDSMHYEALLGYLQAQSRRALALSQEYHGLYAFVVSLIYYMLQARHTQNPTYITQALRCLDGILALAEKNEPLWIFSLNHDLLIECLAIHGGVNLTQGFFERTSYPLRNSGGVEIGRLPVELLREDVFRDHGPAFFTYGTRGINLLKIHGGLDLFTTRDGKDLVRLLSMAPSPIGPLLSLEAANEQLLYIDRASDIKVNAMNEIAFENDEGEMQFLRRSLVTGAFKFDDRVDQVLPKSYLSLFSSYINNVSTLYCVGYGFGDLHINEVIRRWLEFSAERTAKIVSPQVTMPSSFTHLSSQIELVNSPATEFFEQFASTPLTDEERAMKAARASHRHEF